MKRFTKIAVILIIAVVVAGMLTACDLKDIFENTEWAYSEDGVSEINLNFDGYKQSNYKGVNEWEMTTIEGETVKKANVVCYTDYSTSIKKKKYIYTTDEIELIVINVKDTSQSPEVTTIAYINETEKTVYQSVQLEFIVMAAAILSIETQGVVYLTDPETEEINWTLTEKRESTIKDKDETDLDVVEYEFAAAGETSDVKMFVDFKKKGLIPTVRRLKYDYYNSSEELIKTLIIFITLRTGDSPVAADFAAPTEADGYTIGG